MYLKINYSSQLRPINTFNLSRKYISFMLILQTNQLG